MTRPRALSELVMLTPLYAPAVGGAAVYSPLLARTLIDQEVASRVTVLTEAHPGEPATASERGGRLVVRRILPYRAGCPGRQRSRHVRYALANAAYTTLLRHDWPDPGESALLVHASLHYHPGVLTSLLGMLRRRPARPRLIADVRDPRLPPARQDCLGPYDAVIACSESVADHLQMMRSAAPKLVQIPVPIQRPALPADPHALAQRHGLRPGRDLFWPHGVLRRKGIVQALDAVARRHARGDTDLRLAVAGGARDWGRDMDAAVANGTATYLGPVPHAAMPALMRAAAGVLDIAAIEGMPRAMLEAIAVGARVLLPPGVPEFARHCPALIADTRDAASLAAQVAALRDGALPAARYPVARHDAARLAPSYARVLAPPTPVRTDARCAF